MLLIRNMSNIKYMMGFNFYWCDCFYGLQFIWGIGYEFFCISYNYEVNLCIGNKYVLDYFQEIVFINIY